MAKNSNANSIRLVESLKKNVSEKVAKEFEEQYPLSASANIQKKYEWANNACIFLEEHCDSDTIRKIREGCKCNDGKSIANKMKKYLKNADSIEAFVLAFSQNETFAALEYIAENKIHFCYPECYCSCVKHVPKQLSKTWCYCTVGNAKGVFEELFEKQVKITLLESIKSGASQCVMEVEW